MFLQPGFGAFSCEPMPYVDKSLPSHPIQSLLAVRMASVMYPTDDTAEFDEAGANRVRVRSRQG
jgi:hypothetical protein